MGFALLDAAGNLVSWTRWDAPTPGPGESVIEAEGPDDAKSAAQLLDAARADELAALELWYAQAVGAGIPVTLPAGGSLAGVTLTEPELVTLPAGLGDQNRFDAYTTSILSLCGVTSPAPLTGSDPCPIPFYDSLGRAVVLRVDQVGPVLALQYAGQLAALAAEYTTRLVAIQAGAGE